MYTPGEFEVEFDAGRLAVVRLLGEHDISTTQAIAERLGELLESGSPIIFDLSGVDFADSAVVHLIEDAHEAARARGVALAVVAAPDASLVRRCSNSAAWWKGSWSSRPEPTPNARSAADQPELTPNARSLLTGTVNLRRLVDDHRLMGLRPAGCAVGRLIRLRRLGAG